MRPRDPKTGRFLRQSEPIDLAPILPFRTDSPVVRIPRLPWYRRWWRRLGAQPDREESS